MSSSVAPRRPCPAPLSLLRALSLTSLYPKLMSKLRPVGRGQAACGTLQWDVLLAHLAL